MSKTLLIVESPSKIKTIKKFLGSDYEVEASYGHVRDLDKSNKGFGVDIANGYEPSYEVMTQKSGSKTKKQIIKDLNEKAKKCEQVILATDPDREGEAIAWHLAQVIKHKNIKRITFNEITKQAVLEAIKKPRDINIDLFYSQQARRILDRLVGFTLSPVLWAKIQRGLSVGRVQSPALIVIANREKEVLVFKPEEYWDVYAHVITTHKKENYVMKLEKIENKADRISDEKTALKICEEIEAKWNDSIINIRSDEVIRKPYPPFITSTLQKYANSALGWSASKTMQVAQRLYEAGKITYMRTDSPKFSDEAMNTIQKLIKKDYGDKYYHKNVHASKAGAQEAHEAIRPSDFQVKDVDDSEDNLLYSMIWKRSVASQMSDAILSETKVRCHVDLRGKDDCKYLLMAKGLVIKFDGFSKVMPIDIKDKLPDVCAGVDYNKLKTTEKEQKFTKAPPRYSEARLIETLEKEGVGRPSTYAAIIEVLLKRQYVERSGKGKGSVLQATPLGIQVSDYLQEVLNKYVAMGFTAGMEKDLDEIENGTNNWVDVLDKYYPDLKKDADSIKKVKDYADGECPDCGSKLVVKISKTGKFIGCEGYPKCKYTKSLDGESNSTGEKCPECEKDLVVKNGKFGKFVACSGYPDCKYIKKETKPCPDCGGNLVQRYSKAKKKKFWGCESYPECKHAEDLK